MPVSSKNNGSKQVLRKNNGNNKVDRFDGNSIEYAKKLEKLKTSKLSKLQKSKNKKLAKSKQLSKSRNSLNFSTKKTKSSFLTFGTREAFNCLRLAFIKASIL